MCSRRVYVHAHSLKQVCLSDRHAGEEILSAVIGVGVRKRLFNRLVQDGQILLGLPADALAPLQRRIGELDGTSLSRTLKRVHHYPVTDGKSLHGVAPEPLFRRDEEVAASCFDDNYYTFATDRAAADRMYADHEPVKELRRLIAQTPDDPRVADLVLVRGDRLVLMPGAASAPHAPCERLKPGDLKHLARSAQHKVTTLAESLLQDLDPAMFPDSYLGLIRDNLLESIGDSARPLWGSAR